MLPNDRSRQLYKVYKELTAGIGPGEQNTQQGLEQTDQADDTGIYTSTKFGDEQGWQYWEPASPAADGPRQTLGTWVQAVPCFYKEATSTFTPIKDKTLLLDTDYSAKAPSVLADGDHEKVRVAEDSDSGVPGLVVSCMNHGAHEYIFFPISEYKLKVDHKSDGNASSRIYDVDAAGLVDPANIGTTKQIWEVFGNRAYNLTTAQFSDMTAKRGAVEFHAGAYPAIATPETPANYRVRLAWNAGTNKWEFYAIAEATAASTYYAKVRWAMGKYNDYSEGELVNYTAPATWADTGTVIWISWDMSRQCQFHTAGDDTVFVVRLLEANYVRNAITRDLYYCVQCVRDEGKKITHLQKTEWGGDDRLIGKILSTDNNSAPWANPTNAKITTDLAGVVGDNSLPVLISSDWALNTMNSNYNFLESACFGRGMPQYFRPISPIMYDPAAGIYHCAHDAAITYEEA